MSTVVIIGGKLQGLEAVYLAQKAGIDTVLVDKTANPPARPFCSRFLQCDVLKREPDLIQALCKADFVLPAMEKKEVISTLSELAEEHQFQLAFDSAAFDISCSKLLSDQMMHQNQIPAPRYYPDCKAPYIAKPSEASGSKGVRLIETKEELEAFLEAERLLDKGGELGHRDWIVQEYLEGKSYSIEIIGGPGRYQTYEVTDLFMDDVYDCKRVMAPCKISEEKKAGFADIAVRLAEAIGMTGIMDVEVIDDEGELKVLEIDARIPSQTPTAVYHCSGVNLLAELRDYYCGGGCRKTGLLPEDEKKWVSFEHLRVGEGKIVAQGEHIMGGIGVLHLDEHFCGADEAITDYEPGKGFFHGTFINWADTEEELEQKRCAMLSEISKLMGEALTYLDLEPDRERLR